MIKFKQKEYGFKSWINDHNPFKSNENKALWHDKEAKKKLNKLNNLKGIKNDKLREKLRKAALEEKSNLHEPDLKNEPDLINVDPNLISVAAINPRTKRILTHIDPEDDEETINTKLKLREGNRPIIVSPKQANEEVLAHEIGHVKNHYSHNLKVKEISDKANSDEYCFKELCDPMKIASGDYKKVIYNEERNATKEGIELLKKEGVSGKELKSAKKFLKTALSLIMIIN